METESRELEEIIYFKTLTPIWTGDADGRCSTVKETSIIGSMRWFYEAMIKETGEYVCDPSNGGCKFETKEYEKALKNGKSVDEALEIGLESVCPACRLFGCTGWRRRFRIEIENINPVELSFVTVESLDKWLKKTLSPRITGFHSKNSKMTLISEDEITKKKVLSLIKLMESEASLGAESQNGFGVFELVSNVEVTDEFHSHSRLPDYIFVKLKLTLEDSDYLLTGVAIKYIMRNNLKQLQECYCDVENIVQLITNFDEVDSYRTKMRDFYLDKKNKMEWELKKYKKGSDKYQKIGKEIKKNYGEALKYNKTSKILARALFGSDLLSTRWRSRIEISHVYKKGDEYYFRVICHFPEIVDYYDNNDNGNEGKIQLKIDKLKVIEFLKIFIEDLPSSLPEIESIEVLEGQTLI